MTWTRCLPAVLLVVVLTTGCQPTEVTPTEPPVPTAEPTAAQTTATPAAPPLPTCTPDGVGYQEPQSCTQEERDEQVRLDELEAEAMRVYQEYWDEWSRLVYDGGSPELTDKLRETASGPYLEVARRFLLDLDQGGGAVDGLVTTKAEPARGVSFEGSEVALTVCVDGRDTVTTYEDDSQSYPGSLNLWTLSLKHDPADGRLKIDNGDPTEVESCPIAED